jgi:hypothetical protein
MILLLFLTNNSEKKSVNEVYIFWFGLFVFEYSVFHSSHLMIYDTVDK